jgi:hypothetical protein
VYSVFRHGARTVGAREDGGVTPLQYSRFFYDLHQIFFEDALALANAKAETFAEELWPIAAGRP